MARVWYIIKSRWAFSFTQYSSNIFQADPLPRKVYFFGSKMATSSQGDGLIMTVEREVYTFKCKSETSCKWSWEPYSLKISRILHAMLPVSNSFLDNCTVEEINYNN